MYMEIMLMVKIILTVASIFLISFTTLLVIKIRKAEREYGRKFKIFS